MTAPPVAPIGTTGRIVTSSEFATAMERLGPYERRPRLALAVSGGADSMALAWLAHGWAEARGGTVTALTVDHGLRAGSAAEAAQVGIWLAASGIGHRVLPWTGPKPATGVQSAARAARYGLLENWCRDAGILHLLLAHQRDDQAETVALRRAAGSGPDGLAAIAALTETASVRVMRPLLAFSSARLRATLVGAGWDWIEDPSNRDRRFARVRVRDAMNRAADPTAESAALAQTAARAGVERARDECKAAALLARACTLHPAGFGMLDRAAVMRWTRAERLRALSGLMLCISGQAYLPRTAAIGRLADALGTPEFRGRTLGGCRFMSVGSALLVCREARNFEPDVPLADNSTYRWDGRFEVETGECGAHAGVCTLGALRPEGWRDIVSDRPDLKYGAIPPPVRASLPALRDVSGVFAVPHLGYNRKSSNSWDGLVRRLAWKPRNALAKSPFWLALREISTI